MQGRWRHAFEHFAAFCHSMASAEILSILVHTNECWQCSSGTITRVYRQQLVCTCVGLSAHVAQIFALYVCNVLGSTQLCAVSSL